MKLSSSSTSIIRVNMLSRVISFTIVIAVIIFGVIAKLGFYADGAYFFYYIVQTHHFFIQEYTRGGADVISQVPLVIAARFNVHSLATLRLIWDTSVIAIPGLFNLIALYKVRKSSLFFVFSFVILFIYSSSSFFAIGEYNLCFSLFICALGILVCDHKSNMNQNLLLVISIFFVATYPSTIFLGSVLVLIIVMIEPFEPKRLSSFIRSRLGITCCVFASSIIVGLLGIIFSQGAPKVTASMLMMPFQIDSGTFRILLLNAILLFMVTIKAEIFYYPCLAVSTYFVLSHKSNSMYFSYFSREVVSLFLLAFGIYVAYWMKNESSRVNVSRLSTNKEIFWNLILVSMFLTIGLSIAHNEKEFVSYLKNYSSLDELRLPFVSNIGANSDTEIIKNVYTNPNGSWSWGQAYLDADLGGASLILNPGIANPSGMTKGLRYDNLPLPWPWLLRDSR